MNKLKHAVVYLAGPIDRVADDGRTWRQDFTNKVKDIGLKLLDPTCKPSGLSETKVEKNYVNKLKSECRWDELSTFVKQLRRTDLRYVDLSDIVVAYIDPDIHMFGTIDEILMAERQCKPVFLIVKGGIQRLAGWAFGIVNHNEVFATVDECVDYIKNLDNGDIELDNRFVLIREYLNG